MRRLTHSALITCTAAGAAALGGCATSPAASSSTSAGATAASVAAAPATVDRGAFVVRLGSDTIAVERYTRDAGRIVGDEAMRTPAAGLRHYVATLNPDGSVASIDYEAHRVVGNAPPTVASLRLGADTVVSTLRIGGRDTTLRYAAHDALPYVTFSYALLEPLTMRAVRMAGDSAQLTIAALGAPGPNPGIVKKVGSDSLTFSVFEPNAFRIHVDGRGRILGLQGLATTEKVVVERVGDVDVRAIASAWATRDSAAGRTFGTLSPLDTMRASVGAAQLSVVYSRPSVRGRTLLGGVLLPYGQVWRTGANAATVFTTSRDLVLGGATVPAGSYTLWTIPNADGTAKLIVNRQVGQWGTDYDASKDLVRVDAAVSRSASPTEKFTFAVEPNAAGTGGALTYLWGDTKFSVPFVVK